MKTEDTKLYTSANVYFKAPDGMKNEVTMWFVAAGLLMQELSIRYGFKPFGGLGSRNGKIVNKSIPRINILDVCSGPGNFLNHLQFVYSDFSATCVDLNQTFIEAGKRLFKGWDWLVDDVTTINLNKKFDIVTASSAYHHIIDEEKEKFLKNVVKHLKKDGFILMCENFLPKYSNHAERILSVDKYYSELKKYYNKGNATPASIDAIEEVYQLEKNEIEEHKVSFQIFSEHLKSADLRIFQDIIIWQPEILYTDNAGSHVLILKQK